VYRSTGEFVLDFERTRQAPLPSMLMAIPFLISTPVNAAPVNWLP
jgi:hypothetical protein